MASSSSRLDVQTRIVLRAAYDGDLRTLKKMAKQMDLGVAEDDEGANALHLAAQSGSLECCKFLVEEAWIDVNSTTTTGTTPLISTVVGENVKVMKYLLDRGGKPKTPQGFTKALHGTASHGQCEQLKLLLSEINPVDIMALMAEHGTTLLHAAASSSQDEAMKILLEHRADPNVSALMRACERKYLKCMKLLVEAGAYVNGACSGQTALTQAAESGLTDIVKFLLDAGADPNKPRIKDGEIPIQLAAKHGHRNLVKVLFSKTNPVPSLPYWSVDGIVRMMKSPLIRCQDTVPVEARITDLQSRAKEAFTKDYHAALYFFGRVMEIYPDDATMFYNRSLCWMRMGEGERALSDARRCRQLRPGWFEGWYLEGRALDSMEDYQGAADAFMEALKLEPESDVINTALRKANNMVHGDEKSSVDIQKKKKKRKKKSSVTASCVPSLQNHAESITQHGSVDIEGEEAPVVYAILEPALPDADGEEKSFVMASSVPSLQNHADSISGTQHGSVDIEGEEATVVYAIVEPALPDADGHWEPPLAGWIKANVDAIWGAQTERGGVGVVIRDQTGSVLRSVRSFILVCASAEAAQIIACVEGLRHLGDFKQWPAILESGAAQVIDTLSAGCDDRSANWSSYMEARVLMAGIPEVKLSKVNHQGNKVPHCLAQLGKGELYGVLDCSAPPCVLAMIMDDSL